MSKPSGTTRGTYKVPARQRQSAQTAELGPATEGSALGDVMASKYGRDEYGEWVGPKLLKHQEQWRDRYIDGSESMNEYLRKGEKLPANYEAYHLNTKQLLEATGVTLDRDIIVYRGMNTEVGRKFRPGAELRDDGWVSTTTNKRIAEGFTGRYEDGPVVKFRVPKGTKVLAFGGYEGEFVLPPGHTYKVGTDGVAVMQ